MTEFTDERTLYQRMGGEAAVREAVDLFYERVLADTSLSGFFTGASMSRFAFLSQALDGPKQYSGASMREEHASLAIEQRHFDSVAAHLVGDPSRAWGSTGQYRGNCGSGCAAFKPDCKHPGTRFHGLTMVNVLLVAKVKGRRSYARERFHSGAETTRFAVEPGTARQRRKVLAWIQRITESIFPGVTAWRILKYS